MDEITKISKQRKLEEIFKMIEDFNVSNYEISKNTGVSEAGLGSITNGDTKNPREITVNTIYKYLIENYKNRGVDKKNIAKNSYNYKSPVTISKSNEIEIEALKKQNASLTKTIEQQDKIIDTLQRTIETLEKLNNKLEKE